MESALEISAAYICRRNVRDVFLLWAGSTRFHTIYIYVRVACGERAVVNGAEDVSALAGFHPSPAPLSYCSHYRYAPLCQCQATEFRYPDRLTAILAGRATWSKTFPIPMTYYRIVQQRDGAIVEFGAAWKRSSARGGDFLSVMLDDPALPASLHAALFLSDRDDSATLVWHRQARKGPAAEAEPANARPRRPSASRGPRPA